ncbi:MAG: pseudouridine synthase [Anaerolineae bacterium]|nr:pseudouridine synthase [Anaerolineae bacterium]MDK1117256.1 pseudouridine synthase [Anaerolineae bacterium]
MPAERLQKILAKAGQGSRRTCEEYIKAGRVHVNGQVATLGQKAELAKDKITLDGKQIVAIVEYIYLALHKPRNVLTTVTPERGDSRKTVRDLIDLSDRIYPVGRLDFDSEGLILMTNDGDLTYQLTHPRYGHLKEYKVLLAIRPSNSQLQNWRKGLLLEDGHQTQPAQVDFISTSGKGAWIRVVMGEGRKRQIREIGKLLGLPIVRIIRVRFGSLRLGNLKPRQWRYLTAKEVTELRQHKKNA